MTAPNALHCLPLAAVGAGRSSTAAATLEDHSVLLLERSGS
ncbi:hypothetical protein E2C01_077975 [Portunus trituberculatus]|uniref:Uncharacterized protein n=1 Tax=Portunus trituberculatus TaxID=210409 RepID=A0A5B7IRI2_PORTR|nr:hypothetical protein [Portunus trituberculatus]